MLWTDNTKQTFFFFLWNFCKLFPLELLTRGCLFRVSHPATEVRNIQEENARQPKMGTTHQVIAVNVLWKTKTEICFQCWFFSLSVFFLLIYPLGVKIDIDKVMMQIINFCCLFITELICFPIWMTWGMPDIEFLDTKGWCVCVRDFV